MADEEAPRRLTLDLPSADALFGDGGLTPFDRGFDAVSGMRRIVEWVAAMPDLGERGAHLTLRLPPERVDRDAAARCREAIARYATSKADDLERERAVKRREGLQTLALGLTLVAVTVSVSLLVEASDTLPPLVSRLLIGGLGIAGWVALWRPIDLLLYEPWLIRREERVLRAIARMPVDVEAEER